MAYNDEHQNRLRLQHFFFPGVLYFGIEAFLAVIILISMNLSSIGISVFSNSADYTNPIEFAQNGLGDVWHWVNQLEVFKQSSIFLLWAITGILVYLLIFSFFKIVYALIYSAEDAAKLVKKHSGFGLIFWLLSLNEFFKSLLIKFVGAILLLISTFILFGYASNLLKIGIGDNFPDNLLPIMAAVGIAVLGMRFLVSGVGLLLPAFRRWYYN